MRSAKSNNSLASQQQQQQQQQQLSARPRPEASKENPSLGPSPTSPICRCRVMYLGSSVPHITKDGLQGIQEPLRELYPDKASINAGNAGIDSWLSVWSNGILIENVDETGREVKRFFKIDALHYCAAVKYIGLPTNHQQINPYTTLPSQVLPKFLPLDSPHARQANSNPPIFASILRRTTGIKVLECHAFICKREAAANALVRCCFHAYADTMYAKQIGADVSPSAVANDINNNNRNSDASNSTITSQQQQHLTSSFKQVRAAAEQTNGPLPQLVASRRSKSIANINESTSKRSDTWRSNEASKSNYDEPRQHLDQNHVARRKSINDHHTLNNDTEDMFNKQRLTSENLRRQQKLSKSMHHLNQDAHPMGMTYNQLMREQQLNNFDNFSSNQSTSASCMNIQNGGWQHQDQRMTQQVPQQPFYNPYSARVPSYPPQNLMDSTNNGGTLRSIRSMAANSIASTLLRSKKHAKAMSMAQLNQDRVTSFHQPHSNASTMIGPMMMPPVPPMFLPNLQAHPIINGSQTMKIPSRSMIPMVNGPMNFEAMTPKEMKKLLKKSAKYGIDPSKFSENGLPLLPLRAPVCHMPPNSKGGTMPQPMIPDIYGNDIPDLASMHGLPHIRGPMPDMLDQSQMKPILVKPNPEFLKSKAGKKWLKQQKEFKKLLPPHLDGLPIIFGPPPVDALEPANLPPDTSIHPPSFIPPHPGVPIMDSSGYYNPNPFCVQNGRASAASTLVRYSPHSQLFHESSNGINGPHPDSEYHQRNHIMYSNGNMLSSSFIHGQKDYVSDDSSIIYSNNDCGLDAHHRQFSQNGHGQQKRNHMVEQSIISLGDENDYEDGEDESNINQEGYYDSNQIPEVSSQSRRLKTSRVGATGRDRFSEQVSNYPADKRNFNQQGYEQSLQSNDDQSSYSSGIYKRGHMNERAFSYSIRQEHRSSGGTNSDAEYTSQNDALLNSNRLEQECSMNHDNQQNNNEYCHGGRETQPIPVNELTARLENQLNMKTYGNSRIKSNM